MKTEIEYLKHLFKRKSNLFILELDNMMAKYGLYQKDILSVCGINSNEVSILRKKYNRPIRRYRKPISTLAKICATGVVLQGLMSKEQVVETLGVSISLFNVWLRNRDNLLEVHRNELLQEG